MSVPLLAGAATLAFVATTFVPSGKNKNYLTVNPDGEIVTLPLEQFHTQIQAAVDNALTSAKREAKEYTDAELRKEIGKVSDAITNKRDFTGGSLGKWGGTHFPYSGDQQNYISGITHVRGDMRFGGVQLTESVLISMLQPFIVWEHNYHGHWTPLTRGDWNESKIRERSMNDRISSMWTGSFRVRIYEHGAFNGRSILYQPQTWISQRNLGWMNDSMSSVRVRYPWESL